MDTQNWVGLAVACAALCLAAFATYAGPIGQYVALKTHDARWARVIGAAGRSAGRISDTLLSLPSGANFAQVKAAAIGAELAVIKTEMADSIAATGATDDHLAQAIAGELGKLPGISVPTVINEAVKAAA